jgi:hypothetical protein
MCTKKYRKSVAKDGEGRNNSCAREDFVCARTFYNVALINVLCVYLGAICVRAYMYFFREQLLRHIADKAILRGHQNLAP